MRGGAGDGGRVENGDAKNAFVLEWGGEEDAVDVDEARSENVEDSEDVDELDERMRGGDAQLRHAVAGRNQVDSFLAGSLNVTKHTRHRVCSTWLLPPDADMRDFDYGPSLASPSASLDPPKALPPIPSCPSLASQPHRACLPLPKPPFRPSRLRSVRPNSLPPLFPSRLPSTSLTPRVRALARPTRRVLSRRRFVQPAADIDASSQTLQAT